MVRKSDLLKEKVKQIDFDHITSVKDLMDAYKDSSIQSRALATCAQAYENALNDEARPTIILGLAGPLVAAGLRKVIADMVKYGIVDGIVREAEGYSRFHMDESVEAVRKAIRSALKRLTTLPPDRLVEQRQQKY